MPLERKNRRNVSLGHAKTDASCRSPEYVDEMEAVAARILLGQDGHRIGEELSSIIKRKERERQLGNGHFWWGIGQSLGKSGSAAASGGRLPALFSPMPSKPKDIDRTPGEVVLWNSWLDEIGSARPLPAHAFITSRAYFEKGNRKLRHYALQCTSSSKLGSTKSTLQVSPGSLQNFGSGKPLDSRQVTSVVRYIRRNERPQVRAYPVSFVALLVASYCVRLADPTPLGRADIEDVLTVCRNGNLSAWGELVTHLRVRSM
jgi:hypothetical protein